MSRTEQKLEEASFFLEKLEEHYEKSNQPWQDRSEVRHYLSAFISAARSVTWVMRSEYQGISGWEEWFNSKTPAGEDVQFLKRTNDLRVRSEKLGPLEFHYRVSFIIPVESATTELQQYLEKHQGKNARVTLTVLDEQGVDQRETIIADEYLQTTVKFERAFISLDGFPDDDILDVCRKYYLMIKLLVVECEALFGTGLVEGGAKTSRMS